MEQRVRFCGIDVGSQTIKLVCQLDAGSREFGGAMIFKEGPSPGSLVDHSGDPNTLGTALASLRVQAGIGLRRVPAAVSMPTGAMATKVVHLPPLTNRERQAAFQLELERFLSLGDQDVVGDYFPLAAEGGGSGNQESYLLMATQQRLINLLRNALKAAHVQPEAIEPEPVTLFRLLQLLSRSRTEGTHVLVDLGASGTRVVVSRQGQLLMFRELGVGGKHLTAALARALNMEWHEAETLKRSRYQEAEEIPELSAEAHRLRKEIERSLRYVERERGIEGYNGLYIVGGGAEWPFIRSLVEQAVGVRAREELVLPGGAVAPSMAQAAALAFYRQVIPEMMPAPQMRGVRRQPVEGGLGR
ncbi:MAG TPA: pilus assembly protein PilM [Symbiobacteriaceae bacterium]